MDERNELINDIFQSVKYAYIKDWIDTFEVKDIIETNACSAEKWYELLSFYNINRHEISKKSLEQADTQVYNKVSLESLKAEIYDIGKDRNPSAKHIQALLSLIFEKHFFQHATSIRTAFQIQKCLYLTQALKEVTGECDVILYLEDDVKNILSVLDMSTLKELHGRFTSDSWIDSYDDYSEDEYITKYLAQMDNANFSLLYNHADCLIKYWDKIEFILSELVYPDVNRLKCEYENLKKKRIYSSMGKCFLELNSIKYEPFCEVITEEMINEVERKLSDFPEMESLIFFVGKLTPLKWEFLLLLIENYEAHPTGKKVTTWLNKVQFDLL